ncbi:MAG: D-2-hydroxyacid dehydrogenase [Gammaproteobacteria bacterium]
MSRTAFVTMSINNPRPPSKVVIHGAERPGAVPGLEALAGEAEFQVAGTVQELEAVLPGAEILLGWNFRASEIEQAWPSATGLRWIHWCGAGVDAILFPALARSEVVLTNARGVFDRAMAEYALGLILAFAKAFPETMAAQARAEWQYKLTQRIEGARVLVVGVGSIGRTIARLLGAVGLQVDGVGRTARSEDPDFRSVHAVSELNRWLPAADYVINILPLTRETQDLFCADRFKAMKPSARFINLGRGATVDEPALVRALEAGEIAGAALDVFRTEPLPPTDALWSAPNLIVSPHMSGDFKGYESVIVAQFVDNFGRFRRAQRLRNVVDKQAGFVT